MERKQRAHMLVVGHERAVGIMEPLQCAPAGVDVDRAAEPHGVFKAEECLVCILEVQVHHLRKQLVLTCTAPDKHHSQQLVSLELL